MVVVMILMWWGNEGTFALRTSGSVVAVAFGARGPSKNWRSSVWRCTHLPTSVLSGMWSAEYLILNLSFGSAGVPSRRLQKDSVSVFDLFGIKWTNFGHAWFLLIAFDNLVAKMYKSFGITAILVLATCERPLCRSDLGSRARNIWSLAGPGWGENEGWRCTRNTARASPQRSAVQCSAV